MIYINEFGETADDPSVRVWAEPGDLLALDAMRNDESFTALPHEATLWLSGYEVDSVSTGKYDGEPAVLATLTDSCGQRQVGQLKLRLDAVRDARLDVEVVLPSDEGAVTFHQWVRESPDRPYGYRRILAHQVDIGMTVRSPESDDEFTIGSFSLDHSEEHHIVVTMTDARSRETTSIPFDEEVLVKS